MKTYDELIKLKTYEERVKYLQTNSKVGDETFGGRRKLNQILYGSHDWKVFRNKVILRDGGCDLGLPGHEVYDRIIVHHINPITDKQILDRDPMVFSMNNVICVSNETHQLIHYSADISSKKEIPERKPNDTCPWK